MNIELKTPDDPEIFAKYNIDELVKLTYDLIMTNGVSQYCFIQAFNHNVIKAVEHINKDDLNKISTLYLENFYDSYPLSPLEEMLANGKGTHLNLNFLTPELVE